MRRFPKLAILFAEQPELKFVRRWLHPQILNMLDRFPRAAMRQVVRGVMPYYNARPSFCVPPQTKELTGATECEFTACGGRAEPGERLERWGDYKVCVACKWRLRRQHTRAAKQFDTLFKVVRKRDTRFVFGLLHPKLQDRLQKHATNRAALAVASGKQSEWV